VEERGQSDFFRERVFLVFVKQLSTPKLIDTPKYKVYGSEFSFFNQMFFIRMSS
jgi:hypothetical protein